MSDSRSMAGRPRDSAPADPRDNRVVQGTFAPDQAAEASPAGKGAAAQALGRMAAIPDAARLSVRMQSSRRREGKLLERLGEAVSSRESSSGEDTVRKLIAEVAGLGTDLAAVQSALAASLEQDRADYAPASSWAKLVVVVRGLLTRLVLRDRARRIGKALRPLHRALGAASLEGRLETPDGTARPEDAGLAGEIARQRHDYEAAEAERSRLLAPWGGKALPAWAHRALEEGTSLGISIGKETRARVLPRLPGLVGLAAGWWVAHAFTASYWDRLTDGFGLRRGGPTVVSAETYRSLQFWVPLLAAAICAWLGSRLSAWMDKRYSRQPVSDPAGGPPRRPGARDDRDGQPG